MYKIEVYYVDDSVKKIEKNGDFYDLSVWKVQDENGFYLKPQRGNYRLEKNRFFFIDFGVVIKLPQGFFGMLVPRSSTFLKYGFIQVNSVGIIDNSYNGIEDHWKMPIFTLKTGILPVKARVAQFLPIKMEQFELETFNPKQLSRGGFGSTGT